MEATPTAQERPRQVWQEERRPALPTALPSSPATLQPSSQGTQSVRPSEAWWVREPTGASRQGGQRPSPGGLQLWAAADGTSWALARPSLLLPLWGWAGERPQSLNVCTARTTQPAPQRLLTPPGREPRGPPGYTGELLGATRSPALALPTDARSTRMGPRAAAGVAAGRAPQSTPQFCQQAGAGPARAVLPQACGPHSPHFTGEDAAAPPPPPCGVSLPVWSSACGSGTQKRVD